TLADAAGESFPTGFIREALHRLRALRRRAPETVLEATGTARRASPGARSRSRSGSGSGTCTALAGRAAHRAPSAHAAGAAIRSAVAVLDLIGEEERVQIAPTAREQHDRSE